MKRTLFVFAVAAVCIFALAGSAFAAGINMSGQDRFGANQLGAGVPDANNIPVYSGESAIVDGVATPGAGTFTYEDWDATRAGNATNGNSPHGNYATSTVKCVVCHAVHYAAPANSTAAVGDFTVASGNQEADTLLRTKAKDACIFCHATAGVAVNGRPVYNGLGQIIVPAGATGGAKNTGHAIGDNCSVCHSSVHGAGADDSVASLQGYLLRELAVTDIQGNVSGLGVDTNNMLDAITAIDNLAQNDGFGAGDALGATTGDFASQNTSALREQAVGVFCAECHNGAYATNAAGAATSVKGGKFTGHRVGEDVVGSLNWNSTGAISSGTFTGQVAWAPANNCKACHDAVDNYGNAAFPHAWGTYDNTDATTIAASGTKMWLTAKAEVGAPTEMLPAGASTDLTYGDEPQLADGVCLKCHVASGGAAGVGITF